MKTLDVVLIQLHKQVDPRPISQIITYVMHSIFHHIPVPSIIFLLTVNLETQSPSASASSPLPKNHSRSALVCLMFCCDEPDGWSL